MIKKFTIYNQLTADYSALLGNWLVQYCFCEIPARSIGFLSLWSEEDQEVSVVATDELIIQMFTSHVIAFHTPLCLFYIQTLFNVQFSLVWVMWLNILDFWKFYDTKTNIRHYSPNLTNYFPNLMSHRQYYIDTSHW